MYNPVEVKIRLKKIESGDRSYYIGNCDMDISLLDTVLKFFPPQEGTRSGMLVINNTKERENESNEIDDEDTQS